MSILRLFPKTKQHNQYIHAITKSYFKLTRAIPTSKRTLIHIEIVSFLTIGWYRTEFIRIYPPITVYRSPLNFKQRCAPCLISQARTHHVASSANRQPSRTIQLDNSCTPLTFCRGTSKRLRQLRTTLPFTYAYDTPVHSSTSQNPYALFSLHIHMDPHSYMPIKLL